MIDAPRPHSVTPAEQASTALVRRNGVSSLAPSDGALLAAHGHSQNDSPPPAFQPAALLRHKWLILGVFIVASGLAVPIGWTLYQPMYRATALIEVSPIARQGIYKEGESSLVPLYQQYLASQVNAVTSSKVLQNVLDNKAVKSLRSLSPSPGSFWQKLLADDRPAVERLRDAIVAVVPKNTQLLQVTLDVPVAGEAKIMLKALVEEYVRIAESRSSDNDQALLQLRRKEQEKLTKHMTALEADIATLRKELKTSAPDEFVAKRLVRLDELDGSLQSVQTQILVMERQLRGLTAEDAPTSRSADIAALAGRDPEHHRLATALDEAKLRLEQAAHQFGDQHPAIQRLELEVQTAQRRLHEREDALRSGLVAPAPGPVDPTGLAGLAALDPAVLERQLDQARAKRDVIAEAADRERKIFDATFRDAEQLSEKLAEARKVQQNLDTLARQIDEELMKQEVPATIRIYSEADELSDPVNSKNKVKYLGGALAVAAALAGAVGFMRLRAERAVQNQGDLHPAIRGEILGQMPLKRQSDAEVTADSYPTSESVRLIRTALLNRLAGRTGQMIQITSAGQGAGKSTLAIMLSRSLARAGKRTLLVDCDPHRGSLAKRLGVEESPGLFDLLAGAASAETAIRPMPIESLHFLPVGGTGYDDCVELLCSPRFSQLLESWKQSYDVVLVDTAPLLGASDAAMIAHRACGSILVVREGHCEREGLSAAVRVLLSCGGSLLGTVFFGRERRAGYYGYGYGYGYAAGNGAAAENNGTADRTDVRAPSAVAADKHGASERNGSGAA